jgi:Zn-dependent peptidase ImmA (M78 family)/transcriptional regulator with XRE-family HTH domain
VSHDARSAAALFDPQRLRVARQLVGLKRSQLADLVGLSAAAISQFESGTTKPRASSLAEIALRLGMPVGFFAVTGRPLLTIPTDQTFFRSLRRTSQIDRERAAAHAVLLAELVRLVESRVKLPAYDVPSDLTIDAQDPPERAEDVAERLRVSWRLGQEPIPNTVRLLERHGIMVARLPLLTGDVDAFSSVVPARPLVILGADKGVRERSRRDALHELGHLVMHHADPEAASLPLERQAERFASALLFPVSSFCEEWPAGRRLDWPKLVSLKARWGMSLGALLYRARDLDVISPIGYESAVKYMSKKGWRTREPGLLGAPEEPKLLRDALGLLLENQVDLDALCEDGGLPSGDQLLALLQVEPRQRRPLVAV